VDSGQKEAKKNKSLIKLFKVCGFLRQSLKSSSAELEILFPLQADCAPAGGLEGAKTTAKAVVFAPSLYFA
jgi:hypothetical protein